MTTEPMTPLERALGERLHADVVPPRTSDRLAYAIDRLADDRIGQPTRGHWPLTLESSASRRLRGAVAVAALAILVGGTLLVGSVARGPVTATPMPTLSAAARTPCAAASSSSPLSSAIAHAVRQRQQFGLRADVAWVEQVATDPTARVFLLDIPLTAEEERWLDARGATLSEVATAVRAYAGTVSSAFGGVFIDQAAGQVVALFTSDTERHRVGILEWLGKAGPLVVRQVAYTELELQALQDRIGSDMNDWLRPSGAVWTGAGVDVEHNCVRVEVSSANPDVPAAIVAHLGVPASELCISWDGTGVKLLPKGWVDVSVRVSVGVTVPTGGWSIDMRPDGLGLWGGGDIGYGIGPSEPSSVPATIGGWTVNVVDADFRVVASGHVTIQADKHAPLLLSVK